MLILARNWRSMEKISHIVIVKRKILPKGNSTFVFIDTKGKELVKLEAKE